MVDAAQQFLDEGTLFHGRYEVVRKIGAGGMGAVYEVLDRVTRRPRALKVMLPQVVAREDIRRRFQREATVASGIESEHVAETLDAGVDADSGSPFIVLELLKGQELADMVQERGPLPPDEVDLYLSQTAVALEKAHAAGVVHRDLKPENLFVTYRDDGSPRIKVLDFGIAKVISETVTGPETQGVLGSP
ncbi:MAG: serine/threonine-protein kinase, partial [Polyangiaceae bacterium]